jgi:F-type H+-transporting ATPase subunit epsilon
VAERKLFVEIIAADRVLYAAEGEMTVAPAHDGEVGILPLHIPMVTILRRGEIRIKHGNHIDYFFVEGGFLQVKEDRVVVLATEAVPAQEIEVEAELKAQEELRRMLQEAKEKGEDFTSLLAELEKSVARIKVARKVKSF